MSTINWDKWADAWSAPFPKNQMWGAIRSGENDPVTGEPLYRFDNKPSTQAMSTELGDVVAQHRFIFPAVLPEGQPADWENCFCGWSGADHGDHLQDVLRKEAGDHNAARSASDQPKGEQNYVLDDDLKPQTKVVGSGPGGKDPVDSLPDYSDDGEERPIRRAVDVQKAQEDALAEKESAAQEKAPAKKAKGSFKPKAAVDVEKEDEDGKREDRDDGKRPEGE